MRKESMRVSQVCGAREVRVCPFQKLSTKEERTEVLENAP